MAEGGALLRLELQKAREEKKKLRQKKLPPPSSPREAQHRRQEPTIFEGPLAMRSRFLRQWQKRYFCLRGNTLSCYASKGDLEPRASSCRLSFLFSTRTHDVLTTWDLMMMMMMMHHPSRPRSECASGDERGRRGGDVPRAAVEGRTAARASGGLGDGRLRMGARARTSVEIKVGKRFGVANVVVLAHGVESVACCAFLCDFFGSFFLLLFRCLDHRRIINLRSFGGLSWRSVGSSVCFFFGRLFCLPRATNRQCCYLPNRLGRTLAEQPRTRDVDEHEIVTLVMTDDSVNEEKDEAVEDALDEPAEDPRPMTSKQRHELLEEDDDLVAAAKRKIAADDADVRRVFVTQRPSIDAASDSSSGESNDEAQDEAFNRYLKNFEKRVEESLRRSAEGKKPQATLLTDMKAPPLDGAQQEPPQLRKTTPSERRIRVDANDDVTKGFDDDDDSVDFGCSDAVFCRLGALSCRNDDDPSTEDDDDDDDDEGLDDDSSSSRERSNYPRPVSLFDCSASRPVSQEKATTPPLDDGSV